MCFLLFGAVHFTHEHFFGSFDLTLGLFIEVELKLREVTDITHAVRLKLFQKLQQLRFLNAFLFDLSDLPEFLLEYFRFLVK